MIENLLIGILGSLIASLIFLAYTSNRDKKREREKFGQAAGTYTGYGTNQTTTLDKSRPLSNVTVTYEGGNILNLELKEINDPHEWHGIISMESNHYGTIIWRYYKLHGHEVKSEEHRFGLKKFVFYPKDGKKTAYLMGDINASYFNEILIEK